MCHEDHAVVFTATTAVSHLTPHFLPFSACASKFRPGVSTNRRMWAGAHTHLCFNKVFPVKPKFSFSSGHDIFNL